MTEPNAEQPEVISAGKHSDTRKLLVRNTLYLTVSQALTVPLSVLVNVVVARYLGADAFGLSYLAFTLTSLGFLVVSWGHDGVLPAVVARDHSQSGLMLGSSLAFRTLLTVPVYAVMAVGSYLFGYGKELQQVLVLATLFQLLTALVAGCKDTIRGMERTDIPAFAHVGQQLINALFVIVVVVLGGELLAAVTAQVAACAVTLAAIWFALRPAGVGKLQANWPAMKTLFAGGTPFVISGLIMALQPMVDAAFMSKLAPTEAMGWYAVARRLVGVLLFPATALIGALYPTLCRLYITDKDAFARAASASLRAISLVVMPIALGCGLYADVAIALFSKEKFGPAADDLRILSVFVALVYFTMPLGTAVLAAEKQRAWSIVQSLCLVVSVALDPLLVPWFQQHFGNGGLGVCVASTISELAVVACGVALCPKGVFDRRFQRTFLFALVSAGASAGVAHLTASWNPFVGGPLALVTYVVALYFTGAIEKEQIASIRNAIGRRLSRARPASS